VLDGHDLTNTDWVGAHLGGHDDLPRRCRATVSGDGVGRWRALVRAHHPESTGRCTGGARSIRLRRRHVGGQAGWHRLRVGKPVDEYWRVVEPINDDAAEALGSPPRQAHRSPMSPYQRSPIS
jgi:hypothetical protein